VGPDARRSLAISRPTIEVAAPASTYGRIDPSEDEEEPARRPAEPKTSARAAATEGPAEEPNPPDEPDISGTTGPCDDSVGKPGNCAALTAPGPQCESFSDTKRMCSGWKKGFKPRVAEKAVGCLLAMSGRKEICDFRRPTLCAKEALRSSCVDPATSVRCDSIMAGCAGQSYGNLTKPACMAALSAVSDWNRPKLATCMMEGCSVDYCFYDL
jgi:hypothetical protein